MKSLAAGSLLVLLALPAAGVEPYLVKDADPAPAPAGSDPANLAAFRGAVLFSARDGVTGKELWRSDGTAAGTFELSSGGELSAPEPYLVTERLYFFLSANQILSVSDGTPGGTLSLTGPGVQAIAGQRLWVAGQGVLYFAAWDPEHGAELWRTDGTPAGTHLVADVRPGSGSSNIQWLTEYRGRVWFGADDGQRGGALWRTDGTAAGTVLAVDPAPSAASHASPEHIRVVGNRLVFFARHPGARRSRQLWAGDGTPGGTAPVTALAGGKGVESLYDSALHGNRLYFIAEDRKGQELWVSDGTARGTRALSGFPKRDAFSSYSTRYTLNLPREQGLNGRFVFFADDGVHGTEPWITDGSPQGTRLLRDVCPGGCSGEPYPGPPVAGRLYFTAQDLYHGRELWSTDGTREGTRRARDICPGDCDSSPYPLFAAGDRLLFAAGDPGAGREIWSSDGTEEGTIRLSDFEPEHEWMNGFHGAVLDGRLLFGADDGQQGNELWIAATSDGTRLVEDINRADIGGSFPRSLRPLGDGVVFVVPKQGAHELWKSDGTEAGTTRFRTLGPDEPDGSDFQGETAEAGGLLFYTSYGRPWRTDGTEAGTFRLTAPPLAACCAEPEMQALGSTVFFELQDEEHGNELWASDGTREGTRLVLDVMPGPSSSYPRNLTAFQGRLWFTADSPGIGAELWTSDGTAAGTAPFMDINPGAGNSVPRNLAVHAGRLWFFADDGEHGWALWSSDGTETGTGLAAEVFPGGGFPEAQLLVSLGDRLVFSFFGLGLWVSDGTPAGTRQIYDSGLDPLHRPVVWTLFQGRLYFSDQGILRVTDGTEAGTVPLLDRDGHAVSNPGRFAVLGGRLVFTAQEFPGAPLLWESDGTPEGTFPASRRSPSMLPGSWPAPGSGSSSLPTTAPRAGSCGR